jgi:ABC-2 type transport system permease protein
MSHLLNITKKELKELLTPGSIISVVVVILLMSSIGVLVSGQVDQASKLSPVGVLDADDGQYSDQVMKTIRTSFLNSGVSEEELDKYIIILTSPAGDANAIVKEMASKSVSSAIIIQSGFSTDIVNGIPGKIMKYYLYENAGMFSSATSSIADILITNINKDLSVMLIDAVKDNPKYSSDFLLSPVNASKNYTEIGDVVYEGITPMQISSTMMSQTMMIPILIMIIIVMIGSIVISSMGNEKENKTLETLLTLPVKRTTIVSGKLIASAAVGLVFGLAYMVGMNIYMSGMTSSIGGVNLADYGLTLEITDWILLGVMIFLTILSALGICMILGAFVKNYKAAQTMTMPVSVLAMIPMFATMFVGWNGLPAVLQGILFFIPFTHPMMAMNNLMFGEMTIVFAGIIYLALFSLAMIAVTVKIYNSDILITGIGQTKFAKMFKINGRKKNVE